MSETATAAVIPLENPIVEAPKPGKTFNHWFFTRFGWESNGSKVVFHAVKAPRSEDGEIHPDESTHERIVYSDFTWAELQQIPAVAEAFTAIAMAMPILAIAEAAKNSPAPVVTEPEPTP